MKKKDLTNLRSKEMSVLKDDAQSKTREILRNFISAGLSKEKNLKKIWNLKRDLSQILTIIREKKIEGGKK